MSCLCSIDWASLLSWNSACSSFLYALAVLLFLLGIMGCALPYPGHVVLLGGCVAYTYAKGGPSPELWVWGALSLLALLGSFTDTLLSMVGAKRFGCGSAAIWCSALGMLLGSIFFFPLGLLIGPFLGAFLCELTYARKSLHASVKSGVGALIGAVLGTLAKFVVALVMLALFFLSSGS